MERLLTLYSEVQSTDVRWLWLSLIHISGGRIGKTERRKSDGVGTPYEQSGKSCSGKCKDRIDLHV